MPQPAQLRFESAKHGVVRVARIARLVRRNPVILKMGRGQIGWVIDVQALAVGIHDVARQAERRALGALHFVFHADRQRKHRKEKQHSKRKNFSSAAGRRLGTRQQGLPRAPR